jgi:hypothetical protein
MAEVTLKKVPDAAQDETIDGGSGSLLGGRFADKLGNAQRLLGYAADAGIPVDAKVRDDILNASSAGANKWSEQTASKVLSALTSLATQLKPVTVDSLKICDNRAAVDNTVKTYKKVAIRLAAFIIPFSLATFITSAISEAIRKDIEIANKLAVSLGDEVRSIRAQALQGQAPTSQAPTSKDTLPSDARIRELQEFAAISRATYARAWQLNFFIAYGMSDPFGRNWWDIWLGRDRDEEIRKKFELPPGIPNFSETAKEKIGVYQDVRYFAQSIGETVSTLYGAMASGVLPMLYALLGACAYLLRSFEDQFKLRTFDPSEVHTARFLIAGIGGAVVGLFNNFTLTQTATIPPLAIAFLVGYAADVFFSFLESLLQSFSRRGSQVPQAQSSQAQSSQAQSSAKSGL